jgi:hypothetical protein
MKLEVVNEEIAALSEHEMHATEVGDDDEPIVASIEGYRSANGLWPHRLDVGLSEWLLPELALTVDAIK